MSETIKRYAWSSLLTFLLGFGMVIYASIDSITLDSFKDGTILGILFVACRTGVKAALEGYFKVKA